MRLNPDRIAYLYQSAQKSRIKTSSLRYKKFMQYFKSRIFKIILQNKTKIIERIQLLLETDTPKKLKEEIKTFIQFMTSLMGKFRAFHIVFRSTTKNPRINPRIFVVDEAAYSLDFDTIYFYINLSFDPSQRNKEAKELFEELLQRINVLLDHELIHRAQSRADKKGMSLFEYIMQKFLPSSYYGSHEELKAFGNTVAQELANKGIFQIQDLKDLYRLKTKSNALEQIIFDLSLASLPWTRKKILMQLLKYTNKWLKHYEENPEKLGIPTEEIKFYGRVPVKKQN